MRSGFGEVLNPGRPLLVLVKWRKVKVFEKVLLTIKAHRMIQSGDSILVGVSGGADSTALLHLLHTLRHSYNLTLNVAHFNHMFRAEESDEDAEYVRDLCKGFNIPFHLEAFDMPAYISRTGLSSEEASRIKRYELYRKISRRVGASKIALGHNADDQAETVLMRLLRGAGPNGLAGIPPVRTLDGVTIIRPLINTRRADIEAYCALHSLIPRVDSTNLKSIYTRNKIRLELIPYLSKEYGDDIISRLTSLSDIMRHEDEYMERETDRAFDGCKQNGADLCLDTSSVMALPVALARRVLRRAIAESLGDARDVDFKHVEAVYEQTYSAQTNWELHLPRGLVVRKEYNTLCFAMKENGSDGFEYMLNVPGVTFIPEAGICLETTIINIGDPNEISGIIRSFDGKHYAGFDYESLDTPLFVRSRRTGDRMDVFGMKGRKKIKDMLIDAKIPPKKRARLPLVTGKTAIYWAVGLRTSRKAQITDNTSKIVLIKAIPTS
jgi:tRNA(Ile)-lysidine synthase